MIALRDALILVIIAITAAAGFYLGQLNGRRDAGGPISGDIGKPEVWSSLTWDGMKPATVCDNGESAAIVFTKRPAKYGCYGNSIVEDGLFNKLTEGHP